MINSSWRPSAWNAGLQSPYPHPRTALVLRDRLSHNSAERNSQGELGALSLCFSFFKELETAPNARLLWINLEKTSALMVPGHMKLLILFHHLHLGTDETEGIYILQVAESLKQTQCLHLNRLVNCGRGERTEPVIICISSCLSNLYTLGESEFLREPAGKLASTGSLL